MSEDIIEARSHSTRQLKSCTDLALARPRDCAIFLDMDGTLLDLAATPQSIVVPPRLTELLRALADGLGGALAIITGRRISELDRILAPVRFAASGVHGAEMRSTPDGPIEHLVPVLSDEVIRTLSRIAERTPGAFVEPKGSGVAIHYRLASTTGTEIGDALSEFLKGSRDEFEIWPGQKVFEILPAGFNKGKALTHLCSLPPFAGRTPIMIGDDLGDVPAFAAAQRLNGFGLRVASENFSSQTDFDGPGAVRQWLGRISARLT